MAELTAADVNTYTGGRLPNNAATQVILDAALVTARRFCNWYVSPVQTAVVVTVDGDGGPVLSLPTLNLIAVTAVVEEGVALDVTKLDVSRRRGTVEKQSHRCWSRRGSAITVTMTHGFTEAEAADWRRSVLRLVNIMSLQPAGDVERDSPDMTRKHVDDVDYGWADGVAGANDQLSALFSSYVILQSP